MTRRPRAGRSAYGAAVMKTIEGFTPNDQRLFDDPVVIDLLPAPMRFAVRSHWVRKRFVGLLAHGSPGIRGAGSGLGACHRPASGRPPTGTRDSGHRIGWTRLSIYSPIAGDLRIARIATITRIYPNAVLHSTASRPPEIWREPDQWRTCRYARYSSL